MRDKIQANRTAKKIRSNALREAVSAASAQIAAEMASGVIPPSSDDTSMMQTTYLDRDSYITKTGNSTLLKNLSVAKHNALINKEISPDATNEKMNEKRSKKAVKLIIPAKKSQHSSRMKMEFIKPYLQPLPRSSKKYTTNNPRIRKSP